MSLEPSCPIVPPANRASRDYGLILGEATETELGAGELSDVVCKHLNFNNDVFNATGLLINAQNMEVGTFYTLRFDNDAQGCAHPDNPCGDECCHRNHIFHRAGRASIFSLTTTRAWDYAIHAWDTVNVHGWDSEDPLLYTGRAVEFCCPVSINGLLHRGEYRPRALLWAAGPSLTVSDAVLSEARRRRQGTPGLCWVNAAFSWRDGSPLVRPCGGQ